MPTNRVAASVAIVFVWFSLTFSAPLVSAPPVSASAAGPAAGRSGPAQSEPAQSRPAQSGSAQSGEPPEEPAQSPEAAGPDEPAKEPGPAFPDPGKTRMSREEQIRTGREAATQVYQRMPILPDSSVETRYVREIGHRLVATIPEDRSWPFRFHVVADREINAFALPGGEMFINIGTIVAARNEAELAGVMGHEMAHVYMQHSAKQMRKSRVTKGIAGVAGAILGASGGMLGTLGGTGVKAGADMMLLRYSRADESQADRVGAIILFHAHYDPMAMSAFFQTLASKSRNNGPQFMSNHPDPGNRQAAIERLVREWPPREFRADTAEFARVSRHAETVRSYSGDEITQGARTGLWARANRQNGAVLKAPERVSTAPVALAEVKPSSRFVRSDLGPVKMVRPENWAVFPPENEGESVTIAPRAALTPSGLGYGVVVNGVSPREHAMSIDQMTEEVRRSLETGGSLEAAGEPTPVTVAGKDGRSLMMHSSSPLPDQQGRPQRERDWLVTVPRSDGSVVYLVFVAPESDFAHLHPAFERMLASVELP